MAIYKHECFIPLESKATLWRYLDFEKFQSLLETKSLFFCRADKFSDPFEGSLPKIEADYRIREEKRIAKSFGREFNEEQALNNILGLQSLHQRLKRGTTINCWHINNNESDAMWRLYLKDNEGAAILTSMEKMYEVIEGTSEKIGSSKVRYLDYDTEKWHHPLDYPHTGYNLYIPLIHKRIEFHHENEFRLIHDVYDAVDDKDYWETQAIHKGKLIPVDVKTLYKKYISHQQLTLILRYELNKCLKI